MHVVELGSGPAIVLVHGNGSLAQDWLASGVAHALAFRHRVIIVERPGFGYSTQSRDTVWTPFAQARLLRETLDRLGVPRAMLVGHSWGTLVALAHAIAFPDAIGGLVLISGYHFPTPRVDTLLMGRTAVPALGDIYRYTLASPLGLAITPSMYKQIFLPAPATRRFRSGVPTAMLLRPSQLRATAADNLLLVPGAATLAAHYDEFQMPIALITGDGDKIVSPKQTHRLHRTIRHSELAIVPGAGHIVPHITPNIVVETIENLEARA